MFVKPAPLSSKGSASAIGDPQRSMTLTIAIFFFLISVTCFFIHFFSFRYSIPPNNIDEASFFSPAQQLAENGQLSSPIHTGFLPGADHYTYWMPPLYLVLLAGVFKVFGATVLNAKLLTFVLVGLAAFLITFLTTDRYIKICLAGLFLVCPFIIISSAFIRMEGLAILLIVASVIAVRYMIPAWATGILAGLLAMTHPMLTPCAAALALTLFRRGWKPFIIFCAVALVTISPYLFYIAKDIGIYKIQMGLQLTRKSQKKLSNLKFDYIIQSVPLSLLALYSLFRLRKQTELRIFLGTALLFTLLLVLKSDEYNYQVYVMPFIIAVLGLFLDEKKDNLTYRYAFPLLLYGVFSALMVTKLMKYKFRNDKPYNEVIAWLKADRSWEGKNIYVDGRPDVATFLMMNHQQVQRRNAVATEIKDNALLKYNCVIEVTDNATTDRYAINDGPWHKWMNIKNFTTSDSAFSVRIYSAN